MKRVTILISMLLFMAVSFVSCSNDQGTYHQAVWSQDGKDSVVYVNYQKDDNSVVHFYMNYLLFRSLFNNGGYNSCYNYYQSHPSEFNGTLPGSTGRNYATYRNYSSTYQPGYNTRSTSSPSRSSWESTPSRGYSSPSRSYSSPSRSYSSPSRSYSSPSRSSSSPSRSSSSPSRH